MSETSLKLLQWYSRRLVTRVKAMFLLALNRSRYIGVADTLSKVLGKEVKYVDVPPDAAKRRCWAWDYRSGLWTG